MDINKNESNQVGYINSLQSFGTKDGPGTRYVIFMQGCPLRCLYCHNVDTLAIKKKGSLVYTTDKIIQQIDSLKEFYKTGGVTVSGGEPLLQVDYLIELFSKLKEKNYHIALDTSGCIFNEKVKQLIEYVDLFLLDIKHIDKIKYKNLTSGKLDTTLTFLDYINKQNKKVWIRYVLVPNYTDDMNDIEKMAKYLLKYKKNIEKIEILPFHNMGLEKWEKEGLDYQLKDVKPPSVDLVKQVKDMLKNYGFEG